MNPRYPFWLSPAPLVLASGSKARRALLEAAGIPLIILGAPVDEIAMAEALVAQGKSPIAIAGALAHAKAKAATGIQPDSLILAADQTLDFEGSLLMKAADPGQARRQLGRMRGKHHDLHSAAVLRRGSEILWSGVGSARLKMRPVSDDFLARYTGAMGAEICDTVGGYALEALGIHLFETIAGDHATILGLPLLPLLQAMRDHALLAD